MFYNQVKAPTKAEIKEACKKIQEGWDEKTRKRRQTALYGEVFPE